MLLNALVPVLCVLTILINPKIEQSQIFNILKMVSVHTLSSSSHCGCISTLLTIKSRRKLLILHEAYMQTNMEPDCVTYLPRDFIYTLLSVTVFNSSLIICHIPITGAYISAEGFKLVKANHQMPWGNKFLLLRMWSFTLCKQVNWNQVCCLCDSHMVASKHIIAYS